MQIEELVVSLSKDPFVPQLNFQAAVEYERLNQTASAVSFYLRTAEYADKDLHKPLIYNSLLKMAKCFNDQNDRVNTVTNCLLQAVALCPDRPEAYFFLAQFHERSGNWQECYTWASIGLSMKDVEPLPSLPEYPGYFGLTFELSVSAWWIGRHAESKELLERLRGMDLPGEYSNAVIYNLERIGDASTRHWG